jgi:hypothetical protein
MRETQEEAISVEEISFPVLNQLLHFLYTNRLEFDPEIIWELFEVDFLFAYVYCEPGLRHG